jgi:hypothetical protein
VSIVLTADGIFRFAQNTYSAARRAQPQLHLRQQNFGTAIFSAKRNPMEAEKK